MFSTQVGRAIPRLRKGPDVTLLLVFPAADGLLVLADGRRTKTTETLETIVLDEAARKSVTLPTGRGVVMAAGGTKFGDQYAADIFENALFDHQRSQDLSPMRAANLCFEALREANSAYADEERAVWLVVAGFDDGRPQLIEATLAYDGVDLPHEVDLASEYPPYAIPAFLEDSVGHLVRERFGYLTPEDFYRLLALEEDDPEKEQLHTQGYTLLGLGLDDITREVHRIMADLLKEHAVRFSEAGVGGSWVSYRLKPDAQVEIETFRWGPYHQEISGS